MTCLHEAEGCISKYNLPQHKVIILSDYSYQVGLFINVRLISVT